MKTLLVVDDERLIRWSLEEALKRRYLVLTAASGEEALSLAGRMPLDALLTDLRLPGMDGVELVETLRRTQPGLKVFVMSAYADKTDRELLHRLGVLEILGKPFDNDRVAGLLAVHLGDERVSAADPLRKESG